MLLVVRVLLEFFVVVNIPKDHLAEAVKVRNVDHLWINNLLHEITSRGLVVNLCIVFVSRAILSLVGSLGVHPQISHVPYLSPSDNPVLDH